MTMPTKQSILTLAAMGMLFAAGGCSILPGGGDGASNAGPDEFRVVTKAPLTVPPEYSLRPPRAGTTVPAEADTTRETTVAAFGTQAGVDASAAEMALVRAAGANATNPRIRAIVDYEEGGLVRKAREDADQILSYSGDGTVADSATGDEPVSIARGSGERIKLPGT